MALSTADRLEILDLAARYNFAIDEADGERWRRRSRRTACSTGDGARSSARRRSPRSWTTSKSTWPGRSTGRTTTSSPGDGDQATHRCYLNLIRGESGESLLRAKYNDTLVKVGGEWKFSRRVVG